MKLHGSIGLWRWRYYFVLLIGRERRHPSRVEKEIAFVSQAIVMLVFLAFLALLVFLVLYLLKSALGMDLLPGFSTGLWGDAKQLLP